MSKNCFDSELGARWNKLNPHMQNSEERRESLREREWERQTDRQPASQAGRQASRQTERHTERERCTILERGPHKNHYNIIMLNYIHHITSSTFCSQPGGVVFYLGHRAESSQLRNWPLDGEEFLGRDAWDFGRGRGAESGCWEIFWRFLKWVPEVSVHGLVFLGNLGESIDFPMKYGGFV